MTKERIDWVDYAKGICIILVVMMHAVNRVEGQIGAEGFLGPIVHFAQPFRMPDFFLISGLFLSRSLNGPLTEYIDRKFIHFLYFYVLWHTIQLAVFDLPLLMSSPDSFLLLWLFGFVEPSGTLWFVHMLLIFYAVTRLLRQVPVMVVFAGAVALQSAYQLGWIDTGWSVLDRFANRYVYFFAGYAFAPAVFAFASRAASSVPLALSGLFTWGLINQLGVDRGLQTGFGTSLVLGAMGAAAVCTIAALLVRFDWAKVLRYCGRNSIVIYLVFPIPLAIMVKLIAIGNMSDSLAGPASVLTLAACIAGPLALHRILRSTPLSALFERPKWARLRIDVLASARGVVRT
ncbi:MAG: acyltransferase family protein [Acidobacteria bacterium]|nr:acyltransferase family protein [Acidobacteriota bacterium]